MAFHLERRLLRVANKTAKLFFPYSLYEWLRSSIARLGFDELSATCRFIERMNAEYKDIKVSLLDVGSRNGLSGPLAFISRINNLHLEGIEPDREESLRLEKEGVFDKVHSCAVFDKSGEVPFFITLAPGCCSILRPKREVVKDYSQSDFFEIIGTSNITVTTLDELFKGGERFDFVKIDTQGVDYEVLAGGAKTLRHTIGLVVEGQLKEIYEGQKLLTDIHQLCLSRGYRLLELTRSALGDGEFAEVTDAVYIKDPSTLENKAGFIKCVLFVLLWKNTEYVEFLFRVWGDKFLASQEKLELMAYLGIQSKEKIPVLGAIRTPVSVQMVQS